MFDVIHNYTKNRQVFTANSILRALTCVISISEPIETFLNDYSINELRRLISEYVKLISVNMKIESKISINELELINNELSQKNISLRQLFTINYGMMESISLSDAIKIFNTLNMNCFDVYNKLDSSEHVDLINDVFRPIESIINELPLCVIIPSFNNILTINATALSIYNQFYSNYRVIFIDDLSENPEEINTVLTISNNHQQDSRYIIMKQYQKQRQCAGRYIGYHMTYDDEIILFLDGDDLFYNSQTMQIINNAYLSGPVAVSYGSHVDLYEEKVCNILKGNKFFPIDTIKNKLYRHYDFLSAHLRTGYAYLFKNIHITDLLHIDGNFFKLMTDYAEMIPVLEMITPDNLNETNNDDKIDNDKILPYLKVIKEPVYIYNMDNSLQYQTSFARRDDKDNEYFRNYRNDATDYIRSLTKYGFSIKKNILSNITNYLMCLMKNYHIDILIVNINMNSDFESNVIINKFQSNDCLYLTGRIINNKLIHTFEIGEHSVTLDQLCLKAMIVSCDDLSNEYENLQQNNYLIANNNISKQIKESTNTFFLVGYLELE